MKLFIPLLLLTLSASLTYAESIIPVSCDEIARITIVQARTSDPPVLTEEYPYVYPTVFWLKPEDASKYQEFTDPNKIATIYPDGTRVEYRPFLLSTPEGIIVSNTPYRIHVNEKQILIYLKTKEEAFDAARKVCPKIKPKAFFVYHYLLKQHLREKAELMDR
ncbi:hypothetical protein [Halodesulfovibrio sp. MK-HDV]|jgi:hypothetical protein|uniref:hypothetical protein n=1 Tax=unclassified Halodesulfovibrio TaxID=2644657 RepID=UPI00136EB114|nr:hypothetical protein [Halodesulfovibrio sp. MK-HDV]KAF1076050.1 hypothetical protein MKHDV_01486 [Halodesulfovibrio sp. MK-HDV]